MKKTIIVTNRIGIDISKSTMDACIYANNMNQSPMKQFSNNEAGFKTFLSWIASYSIREPYILYEATGRYSDNLRYFLFNNSINQLS